MPAQPTRLADYRPPAFLVEDVELRFRLAPDGTRVESRIRFRPNPATEDREFRLDGEGLRLIEARIDGERVHPQVDESGLTVAAPDAPFTWEATVEIDPASNTALEGLYMSEGMYCTQCEAEGFRRITFYPDRPDVMAPFRVKIESGLPVLLSNGNPVASGDGWAEWEDPWPKPSYLFALVAGDLVASRDSFRTMEGRDVALAIWTRPGDEDRTGYAMDALKRSMAWDEEVYGRPYDLDQFNIVAVDDFNAGAMENKGLNIFNAKYVLASPETATDRDFELIEGIIAHEYFHNWTGNRVTCRDWFQLCLKEGLTVFRDQQFSADMRSAAVKRIDDVLTLRARQFREDAGPLAHPVRPEEYVEIDNFYTATVYEKGAEVIRMLKSLVGDDAYYAALDLYFERHDGDAATVEDWLTVFEDATGRDLSQFSRWYTQAGTPHLTVTDAFENGTYSLHIVQSTKPTPGQPEKAPQVIPIALGLIDRQGREVQPTMLVELTGTEQTFTFPDIEEKPVPSLLRGFSAPVTLTAPLGEEERSILFAHDTDPFNRWEAGRQITKEVLLKLVQYGKMPGEDFLRALEILAGDADLDPAFRAFALSLPSEDDTAQALYDSGRVPEPTAIHRSHEALKDAVAKRLAPLGRGLWVEMDVPGPYNPDADSAGRRALRLSALGWLTRTEGTDRARKLFAEADNMTETLGALGRLVEAGDGADALDAFEARWRDNRLVMDKWFTIQIARAAPELAVAETRRLAEHPLFEWTNPNRFRALFGGLIANAPAFHGADGAAYALLTDWLIRLDAKNPQTAAGMAKAFETWRRYDADRQDMIRDQLARITGQPGISANLKEVVDRLLSDA